jgi:hypothetical protein
MTVARRFDALIRETTPFTGNIKAEFINHTSQAPEDTEEVVVTALVPINIGGIVLPPPTFAFIGKVVDQLGAPVAGVDVTVTPISLGAAGAQTVQTDINGNYTITERSNGTYDIIAAKSGKLTLTPKQIVTCNSSNQNIPNFVISVADFAPNSYTLPDALQSLQDVVGLRVPSPAEKLRYDVAPFLNGVPAPDNVIDIRDSLNILRMVVGLPPL